MKNYEVKSEILIISNNSDDYDKEYMKIKFNFHGNLHLRKTIEF